MPKDHDSGSSRAGSAAPEEDPSKKTSATQIRKAQNRIAQREFRLRKQQYIRDLEARVEILSGDKDERIELMLLLVRNLLQENKELRNMMKNMSSFFGEGLGSCLPRLGLTPAMLDAILNRADTDTAYEAFVTLKAAKEAGASNQPTTFLSKKAAKGPMPHFPPNPANAPKRKRRGGKKDDDDDDDDDYGDVEFDFEGQAEKRARDAGPAPGAPLSPLNGLSDFFSRSNERGSEWDFLFPSANMGVGGPGPSTLAGMGQPPAAEPMVDTGGFPVRMGGGGPPIGSAAPPGGMRATSGIRTVSSPAVSVTGNLPAQPQQQQGAGGPMNMGTPGTSSSIHDGPSPADTEHQRTLRAAVAHLTNTAVDTMQTVNTPQIVTNPNNMTQAQVEERRRLQEQLRKSMEGEEATERKTEALQLITYHLNNFRINHEYKLPPSLMPTTVQRTMPHEHAIDGILFPSIRDRMILLRGKYDLVEAFHGYITEFTLHGDDALDHRNWEGSEKWLKEFGELADEEVYAVTNRWRAQRGLPPLRPQETYAGGGGTGGMGTGAGLAAEFLANQ